MRLWHLVGYVVLQTAGSLICFQSYAGEPTKPIQECELEFQSREASLRLEGINAAKFFHECWWHSRRGSPTDLASIYAENRGKSFDPDPATNQDLREAGRVAHGRIAARRQSASASERKRYLREARFRRRIIKRVAIRRRPIFASNAPRRETRRMNVAVVRDEVRRLRMREEHLAAFSRRENERRERYALRRLNSDSLSRELRVDASVHIPAGAIDGRRSWIGANTGTGAKKFPAVLIGTVQNAAIKGMKLHCWQQSVLFLAEQSRWQDSLVCDDKTERDAPKIWFEQYGVKPRRTVG